MHTVHVRACMHARSVLQLHTLASATATTANLTHMVCSLTLPVLLPQVIPRVNPVYAPTASYVSDDRSRLLLRLDMYGLQERQVQGDGNCQVCWCGGGLGQRPIEERP
jgi:hypothetical protein